MTLSLSQKWQEIMKTEELAYQRCMMKHEVQEVGFAYFGVVIRSRPHVPHSTPPNPHIGNPD